MFRLARLTDYGIMLLTYFARAGQDAMRSARQLSAEARLPVPTVSKILKRLANKGILRTHRGAHGGFSLALSPDSISMAEVVTALEGPIGLTECSGHRRDCQLEPTCIVRSNWVKINRVVLNSLERITLADMARPLGLSVAPVELRMAATRRDS